MDVREVGMLVCFREMRNSVQELCGNRNEELQHCPAVTRNALYQPQIKASLHWLDLRVFYVRVSKCMVDDDSIPEYLTLNHIPLNCDTLLEVNCARAGIYSDGMSTLLKRDRLDKQVEEVTFVNTDSIRMTGNVMFEVFHGDLMVLSGTLELYCENGLIGDVKCRGQSWNMKCGSGIPAGTGFIKGNQNAGIGMDSEASPVFEVYVAGSFLGSPIVLAQTLQVNHRKKHVEKGVLESIPEHETTQCWRTDGPSSPATLFSRYEAQEECLSSLYSGREYPENDDGELSLFNAGLRVGVGIGLSICLGIGIGVGLLVQSYQRTTRNFTRRLL